MSTASLLLLDGRSAPTHLLPGYPTNTLQWSVASMKARTHWLLSSEESPCPWLEWRLKIVPVESHLGDGISRVLWRTRIHRKNGHERGLPRSWLDRPRGCLKAGELGTSSCAAWRLKSQNKRGQAC